MAKREAKIIHPAEMLESLNAYREDCNSLLTYASFMLDLIKDGTIGNKAALDVLQPKLESAVANVRRWNEAYVQ